MMLGLVHVAAALRDGKSGAGEGWENVVSPIGLTSPVSNSPEEADQGSVEWQHILLPHVVDYLFTEVGHVGLEIHSDWETNNLG